MADGAFGSLVPLSARLILADPPWHYRMYSPKGEKKSPQAHYQTMTLDRIKALPVSHLAAPDCWLVLWATFPMLPQAFEVIAAWGFTYCTGGAWPKRSSTGRRWHFGPGYVLRSAAEPFLIAKIGKPPVICKSIRNLVEGSVREHSRKPDAIYALCERLSAPPWYELFSRTTAPGWRVAGHEAGKFTVQA